jgi:hypothetical protein
MIGDIVSISGIKNVPEMDNLVCEILYYPMTVMVDLLSSIQTNKLTQDSLNVLIGDNVGLIRNSISTELYDKLAGIIYQHKQFTNKKQSNLPMWRSNTSLNEMSEEAITKIINDVSSEYEYELLEAIMNDLGIRVTISTDLLAKYFLINEDEIITEIDKRIENNPILVENGWFKETVRVEKDGTKIRNYNMNSLGLMLIETPTIPNERPINVTIFRDRLRLIILRRLSSVGKILDMTFEEKIGNINTLSKVTKGLMYNALDVKMKRTLDYESLEQVERNNYNEEQKIKKEQYAELTLLVYDELDFPEQLRNDSRDIMPDIVLECLMIAELAVTHYLAMNDKPSKYRYSRYIKSHEDNICVVIRNYIGHIKLGLLYEELKKWK